MNDMKMNNYSNKIIQSDLKKINEVKSEVAAKSPDN